MLGQMLNLNSSSLIDDAIQTRHNRSEGVLVINILSVTLLPYLPANRDTMLEVSIGDQLKSSSVRVSESCLHSSIGNVNTTKLSAASSGEEYVLNKLFHFQCRVPHSSLNSDNIITIKLVSSDGIGKQDIKQQVTTNMHDNASDAEQSQHQRVLACEYFHLYDIIRDTPIQGTIDLKSVMNNNVGSVSQHLSDVVIAHTSLQIAFAYGLYGFSQTFHLEDFPSTAG